MHVCCGCVEDGELENKIRKDLATRMLLRPITSSQTVELDLIISINHTNINNIIYIYINKTEKYINI